MIKRAIFTLLFLSTALTFGQQKTIQFNTYSLEDGLSQSFVTGIVQDKLGFIWITTQDGINRYDGYEFKIFKNNPEDPNTIPNNYTHSLLQDDFDNLWFGTNRGIGKMNPKNYDVQRINRSTFPELQGYIFNDLCFDPSGNLWALTEKNGINKIDLKSKQIRSLPSVLGNSRFTSMFIDHSGVLWIGTETGQAYYAKQPYTEFEHIDYNSIFTVAKINSFYQKAHDEVMVCTEKGIFSIDKEMKLNIVTEYPDIRYGNITCAYQENENSLWIGTKNAGLFQVQTEPNGHETISQYKKNPYDNYSIAHDNITKIFEDNNGIFWIGTEKGVSKFDKYKQGFTTISLNDSPEKGLIDYSVFSFAEDSIGNTYIGTKKDLTIYNSEHKYFHHILRDINNNHFLLNIYVENDEKIWLGFDDGLFLLTIYDLDSYKYKFEEIEFIPHDLQRDARVYAITPADSNRLWVGSREGLSLINKTTKNFTFYESGQGLGEGSVKIVYTDLQNQTWVVTSNKGLFAIHQNDEHNFDFEYCNIENHDESNSHITCLLQTEPDYMWLGTYGDGIKKLNLITRQTTNYTEQNGLANNVVYGILEDKENNLWISTNKGISQFDPKEETFKNYSAKDGLQSNEFNMNAYLKSSKGLLYFGGINGYNIFDPTSITTNPNPPEAIITKVTLSIKGNVNKLVLAENVKNDQTLELEYNQNDLSIHFAATNYSNPHSNRFRYRLKGHETEFTFSKNETKISYMNISHGEYTFEIFARSADGVWSEKPTTIDITITPPFWLTPWFITLSIIIVIILGFIFYRRRVDKIRRQKVRLEIEVVKRTRQVTEQSKKIQDQKQKVEIQKAKIEHQKELLEKEKEKVEQLLLNILPVGTAEELKNKGRSKARYYKNVSVLFTDFVGFSKIAEEMKPQELVQQLDDYFSSFDEIIEKYDLEKIKTIGDSYMCAGGVPIRNKSNAIEVTLAALEIKDFMIRFSEEAKSRGEKTWKIRIGINTGEVIAGVIGLKRFAYDIWGSTVNQAQRMEMHGQPGTVNVSGNTYEFIAPYFECVYRGKIQTKHKGMLDMYYVKGIKPELSENGEGKIPNANFWKIVDLHLYSSINYMKAERHIMKILEDELSQKLLYHSINHTIDVTQAVERLAIMEGITDEDLFLLKSAATYHDAGFVERYDKNEEIGIRMAREILPKYGYTQEQLDIIDGLIKSTEIPQSPKTHLEQIMCDADLDYLGRDDFHVIADYLRRELREHNKLNSDRMWDEIQIKFLNQHTYFTKSAIDLRQEKKQKHIREIEERYAKNEYKD